MTMEGVSYKIIDSNFALIKVALYLDNSILFGYKIA
ncbi:hypothetical protein HNR52_002433 [Thermoanaerobacterium thermosulfurigenes]